MAVQISATEARRIAARASALASTATDATATDASVDSMAAEILEQLGSIQIDTISVVQRAHHHTMWSRIPEYDAACIGRLESEPRRAIEYWSHAAAYLPLAEYRFCLPRMERIREKGHEWFKADKSTVDAVLDRIRGEGPMRSSDFTKSARSGAGWWDWNPAKIALEYLFHAGILVSVTRKNFQKVYDLAERALPRSLDMRMPSTEEMAARHLDRAISSLGLFTADEIAYMRKDGKDGIQREIAHRLESGDLVEICVHDETGPATSNSTYTTYATRETLNTADPIPGDHPRAVILSPFDPLIIDRKRAKRIFGFDYRLECYLPEKKRRFGYFALPILYDDVEAGPRFAGLLDAKADSRTGSFLIRRMALFPEGENPLQRSKKRNGNSAKRNDAFANTLLEAIHALARFNGCKTITLERLEIENGKLETRIAEALNDTQFSGPM